MNFISVDVQVVIHPTIICQQHFDAMLKQQAQIIKNQQPINQINIKQSAQQNQPNTLHLPKPIKQVIKMNIGRQQQIIRIYNYIRTNSKGCTTPLSVHGPTGCGKTSTILQILQNIQLANTTPTYVNCMTMLSTKKIYHHLLQKLFGVTYRNPQQVLDKLFNKQTKQFNVQNQKLNNTKLIVMDEIDQFLKDKIFMYNILEWVNLPQSKIILIIISNYHDLSAKLQSKLQSRMKSESVFYKPYNFSQIKQIFSKKFHHLYSRFQTNAINYVCKKIANISSDIRLLQNICIKFISMKKFGQITMQQVQNNQSWGNPKIKKLLQPYQQLIKILLKANEETDLMLQLKHRLFLKGKKNWTNQQLLNGLKELQQMGLISIQYNIENKFAVNFSQYGIKIKQQLLLVGQDQD